MGTPLPPNVPGLPCTRCWGPGQPFGDFDTPTFVTIHFTGWSRGARWNDDFEQFLVAPHLLQQSVFACEWTIRDELFSWHWSYHVANPHIVILRTATFDIAFRNSTSPTCLSTYPNEILIPDNDITFGGQVDLTWVPEGL